MKYFRYIYKKHLLSRLLVFLAIQLTILGVPAMSQIVISGTVSDQAKKIPLKNVKILIMSIDNLGIAITGQSNEKGSFAFNLDQPGKYIFKASHSGFHEIKTKPIDLITGINIVRIELIAFNNSTITIDVQNHPNNPHTPTHFKK